MKKIGFILNLIILLLLFGCKAESTTTYPNDDECYLARENAKEGWIPVWCEEFNYVGKPDPTKWNLENKGDGFGNNEVQFYTPRKENAWVEDGALRITLRKEFYSGRQYTSAKLMSNGKGDFLYGRFEIKAKLPKGRGTWPAIWMMPTDSKYGHWPNSGEIDIMEHVGYDPHRIHGTIHTGNYNHMINTQKGKSIKLINVFDNYHVYAIEWEPDAIKWFVDDQLYFEFKNDEINNPNGSPANWPFDQKFYLIMNIAMGGNWGGVRGIDSNFVESSMYVDYVRVYQKDYQAIDKEDPTPVDNFQLVSDYPTRTKISWNRSTDDVGISHYEVYLNEEKVQSSPAAFVVLNNLQPFTAYELKVLAVDFAGKTSKTSKYSFSTGNYQLVTNQIAANHYVDMFGIQLESTKDSDTEQNVGYIDVGDYLIYKLYVPESGLYKIQMRLAAVDDNRELEVRQIIDDEEYVLTSINLNATGGWQNWITKEGENEFYLKEGEITIKIYAKTNNFNINWLKFIESSN